MDSNSSSTPSSKPVTLSSADVLRLAGILGTLLSLAVPGSAAIVAAAEGAAQLVENVLLPAVRHLEPHEISVVEQASILAKAQADRVRLGMPPDNLT
jgi:hypothetical protein